MKHIVTRMGTPEDITVYNALGPEACAATRIILEFACVANTEGGIFLELDVWLFRHRNW